MKRYDYAPVPDDAPIPDPLVESADGDWCDSQEALEKVAALTAENARLRAEVDDIGRQYHGLRNTLEATDQIAEARAIRIACMEAENRDLTADLARVTAERDGLLLAVDHYFDAYFHNIYDREKADSELLAVRASCSSSTEEQIAACAPPASGEE
jgi:hypothetical protein